MGVGYYHEVSQWSKGEYANANNTEDDLTVMQYYGISYRADDHGNTTGTATPLIGPDIIASGVIEKRDDVDMFSFQTGGGTISFTVNPAPRGPNLDISLVLYNSTGTLVASNDGAGLPASLTAKGATGTYYLAVDGVGSGEPLTTGYSDYDSLGQYQITGTVIATANQPVVNASAAPASGVFPLAVDFSSAGSSAVDPAVAIQTYYWDFNDGTSSSLQYPSHTYNAARVHTATLVVTDNNGLSSSKTVAITVSTPNQLPVAKAAASPASGYVPLAVGFSSAGSSDADGSIQSYSWAFGDGTTSTLSNPSHTYSTPGTYVAVLAVTDNQGAQGTVSVTISAKQDPTKLPDLIVSSAAASASSAAPGATVTVSDTTKNQGTSLAAAASTTSVYLSLDSVLDPGDTLIGNFPVGVLGSGSGSAGSTPVTIPADATPGTRYLILVADGGQTVRESIETNNTKTTSIVIALPDLQVSALSAPSRDRKSTRLN